ncbi:MFS transporter [Candidatus Jidaibacter acanthamoebae]|nr:MFS transporter [Candidatus Jidaibacter acanthamoeba]
MEISAAEKMTQSETSKGITPTWGAVVSMALCAFVLIASEFLPVSLLTPIATDLHITEGYAGQSISVSGLFALATSLFISALIGGADRRRVGLFFTSLMAVSGCMVAFAPNATVLMVGGALLGMTIGGFWSISAAIMMRLVPKESVPKALAILNGGNALATTIAVPLGSFLGSIIGWRGAFFCVVPLAVISFIWQWKSLPHLPPERQTKHAKDVFKLLSQRRFALGMIAVMLLFMGQFMLFTYLRPFLEVVTKSNDSLLSLILLGVGIAGFVGTYLIDILLKTHLYSLLISIPAVMAVVGIALIFNVSCVLTTSLLLAVWGLIGTAAPVGWWTWLSKTLPEDAEAGGGLMVAVIQLAITLGAVIGGVLFDHWGYATTFTFAAMILFTAAMVAFITWHDSRARLIPQTV